ncbi:GNAT family N-acetyltransferase [Pseudomonas huanghezhanensis]|uniref:GNAT family N-acetyltransferase n=1 Tax=Pseudomonas huanghezhanensis TaxID=3002903 RepID=UPI0022864D0B|nr:GNAT family N-acetyltransferase [Pseudomonas sp. BSw22131]
MQMCVLPDISRPLLDKFYRAHQSPMRAKGEAKAWVARDVDIIAALCLTPVAQGHWLTGLFVAPDRRGQGIAKGLVEAAVAKASGSVWLFCDPQLTDFYAGLRFESVSDLPQALAGRLARYTRTKSLVALRRQL